jgi:hypothetical protein
MVNGSPKPSTSDMETDGSSGHEPAPLQPDAQTSRKRNILVNPDDLSEELVDAKRPKITMDSDQKVKCLMVILTAYEKMVLYIADLSSIEKELLGSSVNLGNNILSILFACHNFERHTANELTTNLTKKSMSTEFKVMYNGKEITITRSEAAKIWKGAVQSQGLEYKKMDGSVKDFWYGTMGPYLDFFGGFSLRVNELRLGHSNIPVTKQDERLFLTFDVSWIFY